ncbi:MACPF domain-containing protein At1g14780 isoform X2 [Rhododendron vialii]|uniref:MACPF domain-containing protein At1g14780 isoform X2 n=1 Tax=Rhododendron vialii TaxID=182163 RepID=UPI00265DFBAE|nr:MACPF domain-containing protein At1g14780 isoform X2 [Rhododendron vialii]
MSDRAGIVERALGSLGKGFDMTSDFRLKYCKGEERLVLLNEKETRELNVPGFGGVKGVSVDIKCDKGDRIRYQSDILDFNHMSEFFNQKCSVSGKIPSGFFNSMFGFESGSWAVDAAKTKYLGVVGYYIVLFSAHIDRYPLLLSDEVRNAVPSTWDPSALARFIEKYGTHIVVGLNIGGMDVVLVRQENSSNLEPSHLNNHLNDLGDQMFTGSCTFSPHQRKTRDPKYKGITVICTKRGGETSVSSHCEWLPTVPSNPDAVHFSFIPITSLLRGVPGKGFLSHAINLYMRYKPPIGDLQYFLDFQGHKIWAPIHSDLPLGPGPTTNSALRTPTLQFNIMGPKLYVNTSQVTTGKRPVTGMRLYLEGKKCNRLAIHLQHLSNTPISLQNKIDDTVAWRGSEELSDERYFEPIQRKKFSHICTTPVKYDPRWSNRKDIAYIVTGAQLHVKKHDSKSVLHLRLLYSKISDFSIVQSRWARSSSEDSQKSGFFSAISTSLSGSAEKEKRPAVVVVDSSVYPTGPPVPVATQKLLKFVDMSQLCRGPLDSPGHWVVTGARLDLEKGKICLHVKFALLHMCS